MSTFRAKVRREEKFRMKCESGNHTMLLDEPLKAGGTDLAMNPVEALLSALGACKCINAWIFAEQFGINLKDIVFEMEGDIGALEKVDNCLPLIFKSIHTKITVFSDNTEEEIKKFIEYIELRCPVRNTIINQVPCTSEIIIGHP